MNQAPGQQSIIHGFEQLLAPTQPVPKQTPVKGTMVMHNLTSVNLSLLTIPVFLIMLFFIRPGYVMTKQEQTGQVDVDFIRVGIISLICAALVYIVPIIARASTS